MKQNNYHTHAHAKKYIYPEKLNASKAALASRCEPAGT